MSMVLYNKRRYPQSAITIRNPLYVPRSRALVGRKAMPSKMVGKYRKGGFYKRFSGNQSELKFFDTAHSFNFDATVEVPATGQLNLIPQGVTESTRVGRKCVIKSIQLHGILNFLPGAAAAQASDVVYLYVVQDTQANGAAATPADVLSASGSCPTGLANLENSDRFRILKKIMVRMQASAGASTTFGSDTKTIDWYKKCNIPIDFDSSASTGAIGTIRSNNLFIIAQGVFTDDLVSFAGLTRLRFSDS